MIVTLIQYARATGTCRETARRRLQQYSSILGSAGMHQYLIADAVLTLRPGERKSGAARKMVLEGECPEETLYVGGLHAQPRAEALISSLTTEETARFQQIRHRFYVSVANSKLCVPFVVEHLDALGVILVLQSHVLADVLTGSKTADVEGFSPAFAIVNNSSNLIQEAA